MSLVAKDIPVLIKIFQHYRYSRKILLFDYVF